jgi:PAS domain S-box-containing protein
MTRTQSIESLQAEVLELRRRLHEAEETILAIRGGSVDAFVMHGSGGAHVYTLEGADRPYRILIENMQQGAATLQPDGVLLYCNRRFAELLDVDPAKLPGSSLLEFLPADHVVSALELLRAGASKQSSGETVLLRSDGKRIPVYLMLTALPLEAQPLVSLLVTDLSEQEARRRAEHLAGRLQRLQEVTAALSRAATAQAVADAILSHSQSALGVGGGGIYLLSADGQAFEAVQIVGYPEEIVARRRRIPLTVATPGRDAIRTRTPVYIGSFEEGHSRYPEIYKDIVIRGPSIVSLPLLVGDQPIGTLALIFPVERTFSAEEREHLETLAAACAQALDRARLYDAERHIREKLEFEALQRARIQEALRASEHRYRNFIHQASEGVWRFESETPIAVALPVEEQIEAILRHSFLAECNDALAQMYGYETAEQLVGARLTDMLPDSQQTRAYLRAFIQNGYRLSDAESIERDRSGVERYFLNNLVGSTEDGVLTRAWGTQRDVTQRKHAEEALRTSEEQLRLITDSAPVYLARCDRDYRYRFVNRGYAERFGLQPADIIGKRIPEVVGADAFETFRASVDAALAGEAVQFEMEIPYQGIGTHYMLCRYVPEQTSSGEVVGLVGVIQDITERKRVEEALRKSEQRFRGLVETAHEGIWQIDAEGQTTFMNRRMAEMFGCTPGEAANRTVLDFTFPEDKPLAKEHIAANFAGKSEQFDFCFRKTDGSELLVLACTSPVLDESGRVIGALGVFTDITERRRAVDALRLSEERFRLLAESIPQLAWMARPDGHVYWYNKRWYDYTGMTSEQMEGWGWQRVHDPEELPRVMERWTQSLRTGESFDMVFPLRGAYGRFRRFLTRIVPLRDAHGAVTHWFGTNTDIEDQKCAEEALQDADRRKDEFLAMLAHELRNPLGPIRNAVHILHLLGNEVPDAQQARAMIDRQVSHMARLIDDLLDVSRITRGKILLRRSLCDLTLIVRTTLEDYRGMLEAAGLKVIAELPDEPIWVHGDATRLAQVVGNLLHNANKFTDAGGKVTPRLTVEEGYARLSIRDTGIGMEPAMLARVFEAFSQADRSIDRSRGGLGLGLALVKGLMQLHRGTVSAHSEGLGCGSEFTIRLPITTAPLSASTAGPKPLEQKLRILIIEDHRDAADSMRMLLSLAGHEAKTAANGLAGLELAAAFRPDVVLCDIGLPGGVDGYEVARMLREDPGMSDTRLIALTGYGQDEDLRRAREAGFDVHLTKPVDVDELRKVLASLPTPPPE